jgi:hypothetical protein
MIKSIGLMLTSTPVPSPRNQQKTQHQVTVKGAWSADQQQMFATFTSTFMAGNLSELVYLC